ncbi:MAG: LON peptidase substrate-binding domain-containing protein, partial [Bacteroidota bacterium]
MNDFKNWVLQGGGEEEVDFLPILSIEEDNDTKNLVVPDIIPILPLRNTVLFPGVVLPITVGRDKSIKAVREAHNGDKLIGVLSQSDGNIEEPQFKDLTQIGT